MSIGDRLGIAGLIVAFFGIATVYLWPDKKWIGWLSLVFASGLLLGWGILEIKQNFGANTTSLLGSLAVGALVGIGIAALVWFSTSSKSEESRSEASKEADLVSPPQLAPSASEIASAVADKTRIRELFAREMDKPINGIYMVVSLLKPLPVEHISGIAGVVSVFDSINTNRPNISFGFRPDAEEWTEIPGNKKILLPGIRSEVWTAPRTFTPETKISVIDNLLAYRFDALDRLEAGAMMATPFTKVGELDRAVVMVKATRNLIDYIQTLTLIVNDYVVFELDRTGISGWSGPPPPMVGQVIQGKLDSATGEMTERQVVKSAPLDPNFMLPPDFKHIRFFTALIAPELAQAPPPMNNTASVNLADFPVRIHRVMGKSINGDKAGNRSFMILPSEQGWLPKENRRSSR